ncbi:MAG TPA: type II toxin-antitoxin system RelE/ParE family toxin [Candidatus Thermoplasmatota archaeon]|nr:type II toxin-antitoxin system RelE/ParE family toxin [Candidatus Thermoplasmatota archaeon]
MKWNVIFDARARKDLLALDRKVRQRIVKRLEALGDDPLRAMSQMATDKDTWKLRVGDWRIFCKCEQDGLLVVQRVKHRSTAYD